MFSKVLIKWKKNYAEKIAVRVIRILTELGVEYTYDMGRDCDLAILIGGDGTFLRNQSPLECPILGINPGKSVGYYMAADNRDFEKKLRNLFAGKKGKDYFVKEFMRLETRINKIKVPFLALNDVLISPIYVRRILDSELKVRRKKTKESNSGILVYTPSGSHAYAYSAGAKILKFRKRFGVVGIAPYTGKLKRGEITLSEGQVSVKCLSDEGEVCIDGQENQVCGLRKNDLVTVRKGKSPVKIVWF